MVWPDESHRPHRENLLWIGFCLSQLEGSNTSSWNISRERFSIVRLYVTVTSQVMEAELKIEILGRVTWTTVILGTMRLKSWASHSSHLEWASRNIMKDLKLIEKKSKINCKFLIVRLRSRFAWRSGVFLEAATRRSQLARLDRKRTPTSDV